MNRHRFDPISFFFGVTFFGLAAWVVVADSPLWTFQARWLLPGALLAGGVLLLASVAARALGDGRTPRDGGDSSDRL